MAALKQSNPIVTFWFLSAAAATLLLQNESATALRAGAGSHQWKKQQFNFTPPSLLHPQACHGMTKRECQDSFRGHLEQHKLFHQHHHHHHQHQHKHKHQHDNNNEEEEEQRDLQINHNPRFGKIKVLVLLIQFSDHGSRNLVDKSVIEELWNGQIRDWFSVNAQGKYEVEPVVIDWIQTDNTEAYYADGQSGFTPDLKRAMYPALNKLQDDGFDFTPFDGDGDGRLDSVVMLHSGISAVAGPEDCFGNQNMDRIWPHAFTSATRSDTWKSADESVMLNGYTVNSVFDNVCDDIPMTAGLTCHEYMHTMDMIDLYDRTDLFSAKGVGQWDVMGHPYGADNSGKPGLLGAWMKEEVGWLEPTLITADGEYVCKPAHHALQAYKIDLTQPATLDAEYLLIENRQPIGYEANIGGAGLLIWHIDDAANDMYDKGFPGQEGWPTNGKHYMVAVLPKDGNYDLEQNVNKGDPGDLFGPGDILGPGKGGTVYPNTDSYQGGIITETGITIEVLSQEANGDIKFRVSGVGPAVDSESVDQTSAAVGPSPSTSTTEPDATADDSPSEPAAPMPQPVPTTPSEPTTTPSEPAPQPQPTEPATSPQTTTLPDDANNEANADAESDADADVDADVDAGGLFSDASTVFEAHGGLQSSDTRSFLLSTWMGTTVLLSTTILALAIH